MRNQVTFYTEINDHTLIYDHLAIIGGYDTEIEEVPDAPATPETARKKEEASVEAGEVEQ